MQALDATQAVPVPDQLLESAKRDIGRIDRELRKTFPTLSGGGGQSSGMARLERSIAGAGLPKGSAMQEVMLGDGRIMTKVVTPSGTYCVLGRRPGAVIAESEMAMTMTNCPQ
ncbi:hypothetical protein EGT07_16480 [Herbaspirillum sp. HC18]|nr:hypothetical protein EGT07_16480 [Herbaspirillum sp. HC18]